MVEIPIGHVCSQTIATEVILTYIQTQKSLKGDASQESCFTFLFVPLAVSSLNNAY